MVRQESIFRRRILISMKGNVSTMPPGTIRAGHLAFMETASGTITLVGSPNRGHMWIQYQSGSDIGSFRFRVDDPLVRLPPRPGQIIEGYNLGQGSLSHYWIRSPNGQS